MKLAKVTTSHIHAVTGTTFVATLSSLLFGYCTAVDGCSNVAAAGAAASAGTGAGGGAGAAGVWAPSHAAPVRKAAAVSATSGVFPRMELRIIGWV